MPNPMAGDDKSKSRASKKMAAPKSAAERVPQKSASKKSSLTSSSDKDTRHLDTTQVIITEDEYRSLVAQKAYEIFQRRCAATEADDWMQAERLVKEELLA